jgi:hypothetical protein
MLLTYYPFYVFDFRLARRGPLESMRRHFGGRFGRSLLYQAWVAPTLWLPRPLALAWGAATTLVGRIAGGELRRGLAFAWNRLLRRSGAAGSAVASPATTGVMGHGRSGGH